MNIRFGRGLSSVLMDYDQYEEMYLKIQGCPILY